MPPYGHYMHLHCDECSPAVKRKIYPDATALCRRKEASDEASFRVFMHETEPARQRHLARLAANEKHFWKEMERTRNAT